MWNITSNSNKDSFFSYYSFIPVFWFMKCEGLSLCLWMVCVLSLLNLCVSVFCRVEWFMKLPLFLSLFVSGCVSVLLCVFFVRYLLSWNRLSCCILYVFCEFVYILWVSVSLQCEIVENVSSLLIYWVLFIFWVMYRVYVNNFAFLWCDIVRVFYYSICMCSISCCEFLSLCCV